MISPLFLATDSHPSLLVELRRAGGFTQIYVKPIEVKIMRWIG